MNTTEVLRVALDLAGLSDVPADSGIHVRGKGITKVYAAIDVDVGDLLLAREVGCQAVITHHPEGAASVHGWQLIRRQVDQLVEAGVPPARAEAAIQRRMAAVELASHARNYDRIVQAAALLKMPFLNVHVPCDILSRNVILKQIQPCNEADSTATVAQVIEALQDIPEQRRAATRPQVRLGSPDRRAGRVAVAMAGYTNGGVDVLRAYFEAGVGTVLMMHFPEGDLREAREQELDAMGNLVVTGHMASDSIGINIYLDELERRGLEVTRAGGIIPRKG